MLDFVKWLLRIMGVGMSLFGGVMAPTGVAIVAVLELMPRLTAWFTETYNSHLGNFASNVSMSWHTTFIQSSTYFSEWFGFVCHLLAFDQLCITLAAVIRIVGTLCVIVFSVFVGVVSFAVALGVYRHLARAVKVLTASLIDAE